MPRPRLLRPLVAATIACLLLLAAHSQRGLLLAGTGWVAKRTCSGVFVAGRPIESLYEAALPISLPVSVEVSTTEGSKSVTARFARYFAATTARYRPGLGCTLLGPDDAASPLDAFAANRFAPVPAGTKLPRGDTPAALAAEIDSVFVRTPDEAAAGLGTRAVVVLRDGEIIGERYAEGFSEQTPLAGWSMTKSVTATLVGLLADAGRLDPRAPVGLDEWSGEDDPRRHITWDQLLRMSSGLEFEENYLRPSSHAIQMLFGLERYAKGAYAAGLPLVHEIGSHWSYSSGTTNAIQYALRQSVFGGDVGAYLDFPRQALFGPLGMSSAVLEPDASGVYVGSSFMFATARDWARFGLLYLNDGLWDGKRILSSEWVRYSGVPTRTNPAATYGAHWWLNAEPADLADLPDPTQRTRRWPGVDSNVLVASGFEGQGIVIVPNSNLVVVRLGFDRANRLDMGTFVERVVASLPSL